MSKRGRKRKARGNARTYRRLLKRSSCNGYRKVGRIKQRVTPGVNTIRFNGRVAGRKLSRGAYRAKLVVRNSGGQVSRAEVLRFRVVAKPVKKSKQKKKGSKRAGTRG